MGKLVHDLKLFRVTAGQAAEIPGAAVALERHLQTLIEQNMETMLGIRFLASEYSTGPRHRGRIDSLG
ncbi:transporter, partial [Streptomyces caeni]